MKTFTLKTKYATYKDCFFLVSRYIFDESLAISIWNKEDGPIVNLTRYLGDAGEDEAYLDVNNAPWSIGLVTELGIAKPLEKVTRSGFVIYPLYKFDLEKLDEYTLKEEY